MKALRRGRPSVTRYTSENSPDPMCLTSENRDARLSPTRKGRSSGDATARDGRELEDLAKSDRGAKQSRAGVAGMLRRFEARPDMDKLLGSGGTILSFGVCGLNLSLYLTLKSSAVVAQCQHASIRKVRE